MATTYLKVDQRPGVQVAVQAGDTIGNTTTATLFGTSYTIPADWFDVGRGAFVRAMGTFKSTGSDNVTIDLMLGNTAFATAVTGTLTNLVTRMWRAYFLLNCYAVGSTQGALFIQGYANFNTTATAVQSCEAKNTVAMSYSTTAPASVTLRATWSAADANDTITMTNFHVGIFGVT